MKVPDRSLRIAVVDDDHAIRETVADLLIGDGYDVICCENAASLLSALSTKPINLILLDLSLPDSDGIPVAARVCSETDIPIIMLTGRGSDIDRILGLEVGADDYIVKPFNTREVLARVKAVLRRTARDEMRRVSSPRRGYCFAGFTLDVDSRRLTDNAGAPVILTVAEFDLLLALVRSAGKVLNRNQLLDMTHQQNLDVFDRTVDVLILRLRRKIEPNPQQPSLIRTERGMGYVFDCFVESYGFK